VRELARGAHDVGRGFAVLRAHPRLWAWVVAPAAITLALLIGAIALVAHLVAPAVDWLLGHAPSWLAAIAGPIVSLLVIAVLAIGALLVFVAVAGAIAGPFNEALSEQVEAALTGRPAPRFSLRGFAHGALLGVAHGIRRIAVALVGVVFVFALGLVPVIGTIAAAILGAWFAARGAAYDCYDAVLARQSLGYRDKLAYLASHRGRTLGLGAAVAALLLVPGVNLVAFGVGAAGATVAALDEPTRA